LGSLPELLQKAGWTNDPDCRRLLQAYRPSGE
jgi:hypothetical protein